VNTIAVNGFEDWRERARQLLAADVPPEALVWIDADAAQAVLPMPGTAPLSGNATASGFRVPRKFLDLARLVAQHRDASRWHLLYRLLWRLRSEGPALLDIASDAGVHAVERMASQVRRDEHKMRAFLRFTQVNDPEGPRFVAWYRPDHRILREAAPFFADRFSSMRWSILTPELSAHWDLERLTFGDGVASPEILSDGDVEALWRTYYQSVFNPARVNLAATLREMPLRRWAGLPEAAMIPSLVASAHERTVAMARRTSDADSARPFVPDSRSLPALREAAASCRGCDLYARATQVVFGEGPRKAKLVLVGEQPGDVEDRQGHPFVGPAGGVLQRALEQAGIERDAVYLTNAVKHFSFEERGKRRIHKTPRISEMRACRPWLEAELQAIRPGCIVCLGSTAARSLLGPQARVTQMRGSVIGDTSWAPSVVVTIHPSAVLRADDGESYFAMLVEDLKLARKATG
jgi:DNA polymerase